MSALTADGCQEEEEEDARPDSWDEPDGPSASSSIKERLRRTVRLSHPRQEHKVQHAPACPQWRACVRVRACVGVRACVRAWVGGWVGGWVCVCGQPEYQRVGVSNMKEPIRAAGECGSCILPHSTKLWMQEGSED